MTATRNREMASTQTIVGSLSDRASRAPSAPVVTFVGREGSEPVVLTAAHLHKKACIVGAALSKIGRCGDRVIVACPPGLDFVAAFYGCLYGGFVAVPCPAPLTASKVERFLGIVSDTEPTVILTVEDLATRISNALAARTARPPQIVCADLLSTSLADEYGHLRASPDDVAFLQFTSGSTRTPRGVMVTHANLIANFMMIQGAFGVHPSQMAVSWLPIYHDMGLISLLMAQHIGLPMTIMSPESFIADPLKWLQLIAGTDRPVASVTPVFALDFCADRIQADRIPELDLTHWETLICGAEPIPHKAIDRFAALLEPAGFRRSAVHVAYGLAEATLLVCGQPGSDVKLEVDRRELERGRIAPIDSGAGPAGGAPLPAALLAGCGEITKDSDIAVIDPESHRPLPDGRVGELWVKGPHVSPGYWGDPIGSAEIFNASPRDPEPHGDGCRRSYLRTGDLGAIWGRQLYVTGRLKDLIIIRGRNIYPQDVEYAAGHAHELVIAGMSAAFSAPVDEAEQIVVFQGIAPKPGCDFAEIAGAIRTAVLEGCDVEPYAVVLLEPARIPRTTSGKVRRSRCRQLWMNGELEALYRTVASKPPVGPPAQLPNPTRYEIRAVAPKLRAAALRTWLTTRVAGLGGLPLWRVDTDRALQGLGLDSMKIARLFAEIGNALEVQLSGEALTIAELTDEIMQSIDGDGAGRAPSNRDVPDLPPLGNGGPDKPPSPDYAERYQPFPLTDLQQAYMVGRSPAYELGGIAAHIYFEFDISGLDVERLCASFRLMVERHEMLRAVVEPDGFQRIVPVSEVDWSAYGITVGDSRSSCFEEVESLIAAVRSSMTDELLPLHTGPLFCLRALLLPGGGARLHAGFDLLIADMWSLGLVFGEWRAAYLDADAPLPPLELSFRDWVIDRQAAFAENSHRIRRAKAYWRKRVPELPGPPELPTVPGSPTPPRFFRRELRLPGKLVRKIRDMADEHGVSLPVVLLSAYAGTLASWSKSQRFTLGVTLFDRPLAHPEAGSIIGDFTSIELLEVDVLNPSSFVALVAATQRQLWRDLSHREYPGTRVLRDLAARAANKTRATMPVVFTSGIGTSGRERPAAWLGPLVMSISQTPQVMLDNQILEDGEDLLLVWDSVDALFPAGVLDDMFAGYAGLIEALAGERRWLEAPTVAPPIEQVRLRTKINETKGPLPSTLLHEPILTAAELRPADPAIIAHDRTLTFGELVDRSLLVADRLRDLGVARESLVGVAMESGWRRVVGVLAVLLSGASYCPIDLRQPKMRRTAIARDAGICCLLGDEELSAGGSWPPEGVAVLSVPVEYDPSSLRPANRSDAASAEDVAYVIYTSGSTGAPKGVAVSHRSARNTCEDICERYSLSRADRVLALSSIAFDLSVFDLFGVLGAGGAVVIPKASKGPDPARWLDLALDHHITIWNSVPALAEVLVQQLELCREGPRGPLPFRLVLLSGDWIPLSLPARIRAFAPASEVVSLGGATEAAIWSIHHPIGEVDRSLSGIPYGVPLRNQTVHVLNDRLDPCPSWVTGMLYIGGAGLARGYWRDQRRTEQSFIVEAESRERLYRTGDLARWRPEGVVELIGREDFQVKIGGQRVELGEIEHVLTEHPRIDQAAVLARGDRHRRQLVAFVTATDELRAARATELGEVPDGIVSDPLQRLELKLRRHGPRDLSGRPMTRLEGRESSSGELAARVSRRAFESTSVELSKLGQLLSIIGGGEANGFIRRAYASADGLYPVQAYLQVMPARVAGLGAGSYYYDPESHRLILLDDNERLAVVSPALQSIYGGPAFLIYLVAQREAIEPLYGPLWRDFSLIEVGLMCQLLEEVAPRHGLGLCQLGGSIPAERFAERLGLSPKDELLHVLVGGHPQVGYAGNGRSSPAGAVDESTLRAYLRTRLPEHMVPSSLVVLDKMPLTETGKLDRRSLETAAIQTGARRTDYVDPASEHERIIVAQIEAVLGVERVGATDNLFDLGANSAGLVEIYRALRERLPQEFPLLALFEFPNARALAAQLTGHVVESSAVQRGRERSERRKLHRHRVRHEGSGE
jgi:amino acid adenylation domain-containing protein